MMVRPSGVLICPKGHDLSGDNGMPRKGRPKPDCRLCKAERNKKWYDQRAAERKDDRFIEIERRYPQRSESELAWMAGLFEGEGTITIVSSSSRNTTTPRVMLTMTDRQLIELIQSWFGGYVTQNKQKSPNHKVAFTWSAGSSLYVARFIKSVMPYLHSERVRQKAEIVLRDADGRVRGGDSSEYRDERRHNLAVIRELNVRGVAA